MDLVLLERLCVVLLDGDLVEVGKRGRDVPDIYYRSFNFLHQTPDKTYVYS